MTSPVSRIKSELRLIGSPEKAKNAMRFFKAGPGQYAEGDVFLGVTAPELKKIVLCHAELSLADAEKLLCSKEHEFRAAALAILVLKYKKGSLAERKRIHALYLANTKWINNWDLVDASASTIVGEHLFGADTKLLDKLARSKSIWERRIAVIATYASIKKGEAEMTFRIAGILLKDDHDLMHKAVGWMLRETGKRCSQKEEEAFLKKHYKEMPRTMLRYAIERFPEKKRLAYLKGTA